ncbi:MAG: glycoside hydrolase family 32 protein [Bacteroidetes bacterium]|nr:glycoside hydrolase family 32 protein [Bacteroidota bacterium]
MKKTVILQLLGLFLYTTAVAQTKLYTEQYRPQFHFSPATNWCNDPNGLVYNNGTYHLFYQYNPFGNQWGHMSWGHATSKDLTHWTHLPVALKEENGIMIFSGSCVADKKNSSGLGTSSAPPMVAIYTGHIEGVNQSQYLAYSNDNGVSWKKYVHNPLLDMHKKDFRDPNIFWYAQKKYWVMSVMYPVEHEVQFYASNNLKEWKYLSSFGPAGDTSGVWECPDLVEVPIHGAPGKTKWVLQLSQNATMQYFVGEFDGERFTNENTDSIIQRPDYGPDYYAAITFNQLPDHHLPVAMGWVNNWYYANDIPTTPWKSAMSLPRNLEVKKVSGQWILLQQPAAELQFTKKNLFTAATKTVQGNTALPVHSNQFEMTAQLDAAQSSGIRIAAGNDQYVELGYDADAHSFYLDRSHAGKESFNVNFSKRNYFKYSFTDVNKTLPVHIYFDHSIIEVFVNDGEAVFTAQVFPPDENNGIELFSKGGKAIFSNISINEVQRIW